MSNIILFYFNNIIILWSIMLVVLFFLLYAQKKRKSIFSKEALKNSKELFILYLDEYYIKNKIITFSMCFVYMIGISLIFIILRYIYIGYINPIGFVNSKESLWLIISIYIKVCITIIFYKLLLDVLFKKEINKLYLYFISFSWYYKYDTLMRFKIAEYIIGCIRLPCYRIATLTYKEDMYPLGMNNALEYIHNDEYEYFIDNKTFVKMIIKLQDLAKKYILIQNIFVILAYILRFFHIHISGINKQLPHFVLFMTFFIELYNKELYYIFIVSFIVILLKTKSNLALFMWKRFDDYDDKISEYFYNNKVDYSKQRISFFQNNEITINKLVYSSTNNALYRDQNLIVDYILNNFIWRGYDAKYYRRKAGIYRRFLTVLGFTCIIGYIILNKFNDYQIEGLIFSNISIIVLFIPLLIMIYSGYKTHYPQEYYEDPTNADWVYSKKHNITFWIATILQGYILWVLLLQPELFFMEDILLNSIIKITRIYSIDQKIIYLYQYFDYYIQLTALPIEEQDLLRYKLRQVNFQEIINEITTLKDIKYNLRYWITEEYYKDHVAIIERILRLYTEKQNSWYDLLRNIIVISGIHTGIYKTISYYDELFIMIARLQDPYQLYLIGNDIRQLTLSVLIGRFYIFIGIIVKDIYPSILDIILYYGFDYIPLQIRILLMSIIFGLFGTFYLPSIIHSYETPVVTEIKVSVILLEDMSTIPLIPTYNLYYFIVAFVIFISMSLLLKILENKRKKELKKKTPINND